MKLGRKVKKVAIAEAIKAEANTGIGAKNFLYPASNETDKSNDHDERTRGSFAQGKPIDHLDGSQPVVMFHRTLVDIGQNRIGSAEG